MHIPDALYKPVPSCKLSGTKSGYLYIDAALFHATISMPMKTRILSLATALFLLAGCAQNISPDTYSVGGTGKVSKTVPGVIVGARAVSVAGTNKTGRTVGAAAGAAAGSAIGGGTRSHILGAIGGALIGGIAGGVAEEGITAQGAIEYIVETDNGELVTLTQGPDPAFQKGDRVLILYGSKARIIADER